MTVKLKKGDDRIPRRPSNQSTMRVEKFGTIWYAIGGGVCTQGKTPESAEKGWHDAMRYRLSVGYKYKD